VVPHTEVSEFACPWATPAAKLEAVKMAMLAETARRLNCKLKTSPANPLMTSAGWPIPSQGPPHLDRLQKSAPATGADSGSSAAGHQKPHQNLAPTATHTKK